MPDPVILGASGATEQPMRYGWSPQRGFHTIRVWRGKDSAITTLANTLSAGGYDWEITKGPGGISSVEARIAQDVSGGGGGPARDIVDDWQLMPNKVQKPVLETDCTAVNGLTADELAQIRKAIQSAPEDTPAWTNPTEQIPIYDLMKAGVEHKVVYQPILRHTWTVPLNAYAGFNFSYVGRILTTNSLFRSERVPGDFLLPIKQFTALYPNPTRSDSVALAYGWLKEMPDLQLSAFTRRQVNAQYEFGLWSTLLYGAAV